MTDSEIVVALECCTAKPRALCKECPYFLGNGKCKLEALQRDSIALVKRQQAEIERLTETLNATIAGQATLQRYIAVARADAVKEFAERLIGKAKSMRDRFLLISLAENVKREMCDGGDQQPTRLPMNATAVAADLIDSLTGDQEKAVDPSPESAWRASVLNTFLGGR